MADKIITEELLPLGSDFHDVKNKFKDYLEKQRLAHLLSPTSELHKEHIYAFDEKNKVLRYKTETISPSYQASRKPILLLFSNPHPESCRSGLFLSEPYSRAFWQRLCETGHFHIPKEKLDLASWDEFTAKKLGKLMVNGDYESDFLFYFRCFYPIPTTGMKDFDSIFKSNMESRNRIERTSQAELMSLLGQYKIKHIIAFTVRLFRRLTDTNKTSWRDLVRQAKNGAPDFPTEKDVEERSAGLSMGSPNVRDINVHMALDTGFNFKYLRNSRGEHYFTLILAALFRNILAATA